MKVHPSARRAMGLAIDLTAPALLTAATVHELLYNRSGLITWALAMAIIWVLAWRRRAPVVVLALSLLFAITLWAMNTLTVADLSPLVALYSVAAHRRTRDALVAAAAVESGVVLLAVRFAPGGSINDAVILLSGLAAAALLGGTTMRAQRRYLASVEDRARRLERERFQQAELAAADERTRIAREMHDIVAHGLSVVITLAEGAAIATVEHPDTAAHAMRQAAAAGRQSLEEMRQLLHVLRTDETAAERAPQPDLAMLDDLVDDVRRTGLDVRTVGTAAALELSPTAQTTMYRIVQEALTNVLKHADSATAVTITFDTGPSGIRFAIENNGGSARRCAGGASQAGNGLAGMQERVAMFGGFVEGLPTTDGWIVRGHLTNV